MFYVLCTQNSMVTLNFTFDLRSGQIQVKKAKLWKSIFSLKKHAYISCPVLSQDSKNAIFLSFDNLKFRKKSSFKKVVWFPLLGFGAIAQPKIKIPIGLTFCTHVGGTYSTICILVFWISTKFSIFGADIFEKKKPIFFIENHKKSKIPTPSHFVERLFWHLLVFVGCTLL